MKSVLSLPIGRVKYLMYLTRPICNTQYVLAPTDWEGNSEVRRQGKATYLPTYLGRQGKGCNASPSYSLTRPPLS